MTDVMDLDPEESGEVEERSSRAPDPATREAAAGESPPRQQQAKALLEV